jgi:hypothetical protein
MTDKYAEWIVSWIEAVASGKASMSQRKRSSIDAHGGLELVIALAREKGVHLVQLTDDRGAVLVAASRERFEALC